ncbi:MAG: DUF2298 domain-containing protein [Thermoanaerobaculales bacterium]|nr:DUF2298 domain-containing protein [Thermoanaerobaculales bacterium]
MRSRTFPACLFLLALALRLGTQAWDAGTPPSPHPDERRVVMTAEQMEGWLSDPEFYAYGALHFQAIRAAAFCSGLEINWSNLVRGGRFLSLFSSMMALFLGWWMARRVWGQRAAVFFLALAAFVPLDQQLSHFATVEAHHAFWVMAALLGIFRLGRRLSPGWAVIAGAAVGASLAVKVSSLALVLPLAMVLLVGIDRVGVLHRISLAAFASAGIFAAFWLGEPWAFANAQPPVPALVACVLAILFSRAGQRANGRTRISWALASAGALGVAVFSVIGGFFSPAFGLFDLVGGSLMIRAHPAFLRGVHEQIAMVSGAADLPYIRVYHGTYPFLYSLRELSFWALGPALLLAAIWGGFRAAVVLGRRRRRLITGRLNEGSLLLFVLLAWALPTALRLATLEVKFLRYWAPLVVPATLLAAWGLSRLRGPAGRRLTSVVMVVTVLWGVAYFWSFVEPHPFGTASRWLQLVVDREAVVAWEHWDEHLGGIGGESLVLESYNLPDDDAKVESWCEKLARADWLVLTSNRVRRTVLANPGRFPRTGRLYRLLLAGETGFEVVAAASRGPRIAGLGMPVQRADESFVNYDFPRVVVLRRVCEVNPTLLADRTLHPLPVLEVLNFAALDRVFVDPAPDIPVIPNGTRQVVDSFLWLSFFALIGVATWILLLPLLRAWPDGGLGLALSTGWIISAYLLWLGSRLHFLTVGPGTATLVTALLICSAVVVGHRRWAEVRRVAAKKRRGMAAVLAVFVVVFGIFLLARLFNPAIFWGEKPMDFTFFNAFVNASSWPPGEPWMAGMPLHYYYFADVLAAFPTLVAGPEPSVAYNLMCATVPALSAAALAAFGLVVARRRRRRWFFVIPVLVGLVGNLAWPWLMPLARSGRWFDLWWATSRVVPGYAIDEYPLWTALFADLHAHFVALPVMVTALLWAWVTALQGDRLWIGAALMCGLSTAVLAASNPWDVVVLTVSLAVAIVMVATDPLRSLARLGVAAVVSLLAAAPFLVELAAWLGGGEGIGGRPLLFLTEGDFAPWWAILRHFGLFILPLAGVAIFRASRRHIVIGVLAVGGIALGLAFGSTAAALTLPLTILFLGTAVRNPDRWMATAWSLAGSAMAVVAFAERFTLLDRMNTIFKLYNGVWLLMAIALGILLLRARGPRLKVALTLFVPLAVFAFLNLPLGVAQGWLEPRVSSPRPTLDGQAYLVDKPDDDFLVHALRGAAHSDDVVAEAAGLSYRGSTRIAMHTGLATVVGWEWHLRQRGQTFAEYERRVRDLETLYSSADPVERRAVLDRYGVDWVVLGDLERETYGLEDEDPLCGIPGVLLWARQGKTLLYRIGSSSSGPPGFPPCDSFGGQ